MAWSRLQNVLDFLAYWKLQFSLATAMYVLDPEEKVVVSVIMLAIVSLIGYTIVTYLPGHLIMMVNFLSSITSGGEHTTHARQTFS